MHAPDCEQPLHMRADNSLARIVLSKVIGAGLVGSPRTPPCCASSTRRSRWEIGRLHLIPRRHAFIGPAPYVENGGCCWSNLLRRCRPRFNHGRHCCPANNRIAKGQCLDSFVHKYSPETGVGALRCSQGRRHGQLLSASPRDSQSAKLGWTTASIMERCGAGLVARKSLDRLTAAIKGTTPPMSDSYLAQPRFSRGHHRFVRIAPAPIASPGARMRMPLATVREDCDFLLVAKLSESERMRKIGPK